MNRFEIIMNFCEKFSAFLIFFIISPCSSANNAHHHHSPSLSTPYFGQYAGPFQDYGHHGIEGELYLVDDRSLFLYNFSYDGLDSDVYFKVGTSQQPNTLQGVIIQDELGRSTKLNQYTRQNLLLTLPEGLTNHQIKWLSLWNNLFSARVPHAKSLGPFLGVQNAILSAQAVWAMDDRTLLIKQFYFDPIVQSNWGFYVGRGSAGVGSPSQGYRIPDEKGSFQKLRTYFNEDLVLKLPRDLSLIHLDWLAIYDGKRKQSVAHLHINRNTLNVPPNMAFLLTYVTSFSNCETIFPGLLQLGWEVRDGTTMFMQLEARIASNQYASIGISASSDSVQMVGSDAWVAYFDVNNNKVTLDDYVIMSKSQCNPKTRQGVCRDTEVGGRNDLQVLMSSYIDGLLKVSFKRPLRTGDLVNDLPLVISRHTHIVAAIGTLDTFKNPSYHTIAVNSAQGKGGMITPQQTLYSHPPLPLPSLPSNSIFSPSASGSMAQYELEPWEPATIVAQNHHVFQVVLGPAGPPAQGYSSITGLVSPGLAFWIDDLLVPELHVTRGHQYTFIVQTGSMGGGANHSRYHPFYITDSREGGDSRLSVQELFQLPGHRVYAGLDLSKGFVDGSQAMGRYCELVEDPARRRAFMGSSWMVRSIQEYRQTLRLVCEPGKIGAFQWRPDETTPDLVYYQCFNHRNLGWRIVVHNNPDGEHQHLAHAQGQSSSSSSSSSIIGNLGCSLAFWLLITKAMMIIGAWLR